ncbi:alanine--tRNA ligase, mitochondrial [Engraulis encrasicolus]|uniref:alanine--tRNA ligase, mitochondrial n=1 Tax=Engraulis encrasicolus TaxID=184585 RepID=UPI002FD19AA8
MAAPVRILTASRSAVLNMHFTFLAPLSRKCSTLPHSHVHKEFSSKWVRRKFIDYFKDQHGHRYVPSSPVRPRGDPSLLFVNAGMNQFKPILLGSADPRSEMSSYQRVVNSQKCVRAGGKHNDLEDVGKDVYHHTFFEMLGNWSFGDYFKEEACSMAWRLLTEEYGLPPDRLYVSFFSGDAASGLPPDHETREIWRSLGVPAERILPFGMGDNFWEMGATGPCGPCTEIHYDHVGARLAPALVNADSPDVVEIWNLVFMQYNREADGSLRPLPQLSVDTGMGLERLVTVLQGQRSNYDTDLFTPLLHAIHQCSGVAAYGGRVGEEDHGRVDTAYRVVADHIRTLSICIADGVYPGMTGAELVLRRILRRAVRYLTEVLQAPQGSLANLVPTVVQSLGEDYPELQREQDRIMDIVSQSEDHFLSSLRQGRRMIDRTIGKMAVNDTAFPAPVAWSLHRNLGFPLDLVHLMLEERGKHVDTHTLQQLEQQERERAESQSAVDGGVVWLDVHSLTQLQKEGAPSTDDSPKYNYSLRPDGTYVFPPCSAEVLAVFSEEGARLEEVGEGRPCLLLLDRTCFYGQQGGQDTDQGYLTRQDLQDVLYPVGDVQVVGGYVLHHVIATDTLRPGHRLQLHIDQVQRLACMVKHTATHLLNFGLLQLMGSGVAQRGSHVSAQRLRFDFSVKSSLSVSELQQLESLIGRLIHEDLQVHTQEVPLALANQIPGLRTVDEVYPDPVRVVSVSVAVPELLEGRGDDTPTSVELCCGTHLKRTGCIGDLVITSERQMVRGVSRILAVTGDDAREARETGSVLEKEVEALAARVAAVTTPSLHEATRLAKDAGQLIDALEGTAIPQWQKRVLQTRMKALQRATNTTIRKMELKEASLLAQRLHEKHAAQKTLVDTIDTDSISVLMKTVNRCSDLSPGCHVMLLAPQPSGKVLCACQVPKEGGGVSASAWAVAVCGRLGGNAGGSATVAKGVGNSSSSREEEGVDITHTLTWAQRYAERGGDV